jgi:hypothetical protein
VRPSRFENVVGGGGEECIISESKIVALKFSSIV